MTENHDEEEEYLSAGEAAQFLAQQWGVPDYKRSAFKMLRYRWGLEPDILTSNASLWKKSRLKQIPKPDRNRPRRQKKRNHSPGEDEGSLSVSLLNAVLPLVC